jgi:hypothetical protein
VMAAGGSSHVCQGFVWREGGHCNDRGTRVGGALSSRCAKLILAFRPIVAAPPPY